MIVNKQKLFRVSKEWRHYIRCAVSFCVSADFAHPAEVHVALVGERTIRRMNGQFRGKDQVTDVLSFPTLQKRGKSLSFSPTDVDPQTKRVFLGDILICLPRMRQQGTDYGHGDARELAFLTAHGTLHLLGYDHETVKDEKVMRLAQTSSMNKIGLGLGEI